MLDRIRAHLLGSGLLEPSLDAYREEVLRARTESEARSSIVTTQLAEVAQRIRNLTDQLAATVASPLAGQIIVEEMNRLAAEQTRLKAQSASAGRTPLPDLDVASIAERIGATLDRLQSELEGSDREAARAREIVRGMVDKLTLTPNGPLADGRGGGDMLVTVSGPLSGLIDLANLEPSHVAKHEHGPTFMLGNAIGAYTFTYPLDWRDPRLQQVFSDLPACVRLLDEAVRPVLASAFTAAVEAMPWVIEGPPRSTELRARNVLLYFSKRGLVRSIYIDRWDRGYVWEDSGLSDAEWKARARDSQSTPTRRRVRITPPEAVVVVLSTDRTADTAV